VNRKYDLFKRMPDDSRAPKKPEDTNEDLLTDELPTEEEIAARALELYENRRKNGRDDGKAAIDDWLGARRQLGRASKRSKVLSKRITCQNFHGDHKPPTHLPTSRRVRQD
jgi:hypothetical protein